MIQPVIEIPSCGRRVMSFDSLDAPGDFYMRRQANGHKLYFVCPCDCGVIHFLLVLKEAAAWNKSLDQPTLGVMLDIDDGHWRGWLNEGIFIGVKVMR